MLSQELKDRIEKIKVVAMDLDGVLTDGRIIYGDYGDELKFFDVQDGFGLALLREAGLKTVIVSSRKSRTHQRRAGELKITKLYQNVKDKLKCFQEILKRYKLRPEEICFIGDDWVDAPILSRAGLAVAVSNAVPEIKELAHYVTQKLGGRGAVREVADLLLKGLGRREETRELRQPEDGRSAGEVFHARRPAHHVHGIPIPYLSNRRARCDHLRVVTGLSSDLHQRKAAGPRRI